MGVSRFRVAAHQFIEFLIASSLFYRHNSHIGDARHTTMAWHRNELNIGQLVRERFGSSTTCLIGFGTHTGTVACASDWDEPVEIKRVVPSRPDSYERLFHDSGLASCVLDLRRGLHKGGREATGKDGNINELEELREALMEPRLERFIGVIYKPETERWSHYSMAVLTRQFDAYVWFDETNAVKPLEGAGEPARKDENPAVEQTYPFGQ